MLFRQKPTPLRVGFSYNMNNFYFLFIERMFCIMLSILLSEVLHVFTYAREGKFFYCRV